MKVLGTRRDSGILDMTVGNTTPPPKKHVLVFHRSISHQDASQPGSASGGASIPPTLGLSNTSRTAFSCTLSGATTTELLHADGAGAGGSRLGLPTPPSREGNENADQGGARRAASSAARR